MVRYLHFDGCCILYGHGDIRDAHCPREYIKISDLKLLPKRYADMAGHLLSLPQGTGYRAKAQKKSFKMQS